MVANSGFNYGAFGSPALNGMPDGILARSAQAGNAAACEYLLSKYRGLVLTKIRSYYLMGGEREDLVQVGMLGLWQSIMDYSPEKDISLTSFARICIERHIITAIKAATRCKQSILNNAISLDQICANEDEAEFNLADLITSGAESDPAAAFEHRENALLLMNYLRSILSELEWRAFVGYQNGLTYKEVADRLDCSIKSVDNALGRVKRKLMEIPTGIAN